MSRLVVVFLLCSACAVTLALRLAGYDQLLLITYSNFGCVRVPRGWQWRSWKTSETGNWTGLGCMRHCSESRALVALVSGDRCACSDYGNPKALMSDLVKRDPSRCQPCVDSILVNKYPLTCGAILPTSGQDEPDRLYSVYNILIE